MYGIHIIEYIQKHSQCGQLCLIRFFFCDDNIDI
jgi:hypothetical protein